MGRKQTQDLLMEDIVLPVRYDAGKQVVLDLGGRMVCNIGEWNSVQSAEKISNSERLGEVVAKLINEAGGQQRQNHPVISSVSTMLFKTRSGKNISWN